MAGCCSSRDYDRFFGKRFARSFAKKYRRRGLDKTSRKMADFLRERGIEGATVLEIGGGVGEIEIELLKAGAARAENLELSPAYEEEARTLAEEAGLGGRIHWRIHDVADDPEAVEPADIVVMHRVVCCYRTTSACWERPPTMRGARSSSAIRPGTCSRTSSTVSSIW